MDKTITGSARAFRVLLAVLAALAMVTAAPPAAARSQQSKPAAVDRPRLSVTEVAVAGQTLSWRDCGDGLRCEQLTVPSDWSEWDSPSITLGLAQLPARDQARKQGVLVMHLGGPVPMISGLRRGHAAFAGLTEWFDVVTFDPRGFEESSGIACPIPAPFEPEWVSPDQATYEAYAERNRRFGQACTKAAGPLAGNLNSWQIAHDMDAIRAALGEDELVYYGNSYGTVFGQAYAELFRHRVGRMYLDSASDHTNPSVLDGLVPSAETSERNLHRFADWCARTASCALHGRDVLTIFDQVSATAAQQPIPAPAAGSQATVSASLIVARAIGVSYEQTWAGFAEALAEAHAGDASKFATQPPGGRDPDLSRIMICADHPYPSDYQEVKALEASLRRVAPRLGWAQAWVMAAHCAGLPATRTFPPHAFQTKGLPPVLIANGDDDHATPPEHGRRLAAQLPGARYLPAQGGHALYWMGHPCVREHVHRYLTTGELPPEGAACGAAPARTGS